MAHYNFYNDAKEERMMKEYMEKKGIDVLFISEALGVEVVESEWMKGNFPDYDQRVTLADGKVITIEWKMDRRCIGTGNIYFERQCRGKPSGIMTTKSDYWAEIVFSKTHMNKLRFGIWKTLDIKTYIKNGLKTGEVWVPDGEKAGKLAGDTEGKWSNGAARGWITEEDSLFDSPFLIKEKRIDTVKLRRAAGII